MSLNYRGRVLHDAECSCCTLTYADAAPANVDPTGTGKIRRAMRSAMNIKLNSLRPMLRAQLVTNDVLGLNIKSAMSSMMAASMAAGGSSAIDMFQRLFDTMLQNTLLENQGEYVKTYIRAGYEKGARFGRTNIQASPEVSPGLFQEDDRIATLQKFTYVELQGVAEAISQQGVRVVSNGLLTKQGPQKILRSLFAVISKVGMRTDAVAEFMVVRAFGEGSLDTYEAAGIKQVALIAEAKAKKTTIGDARSLRRGKRTGAGSRVSRTQSPSASTIARIRRQEAELERLKLVRVKTAGDDDVCPICEDIADDGPYNINEARSLIPAHPRCRCVLVPAYDARFAEDVRTLQ